MQMADRRLENGRVDRRIEKFEDLEVWKEGMKLTSRIYARLRPCKDYALRDQMQRSAVSIPSNIAEGYDRNTNKEFIHHLFIARGSCAELRTQIHLCLELNVLEDAVGGELLERTRKLSAMLFKLIKTRKEKF